LITNDKEIALCKK